MTPAEFWERVERTNDGHWIYSGSMTAPTVNGVRGAARIAWTLRKGKIGGQLDGQVENVCGHKSCVNPAHYKVSAYVRRGSDPRVREFVYQQVWAMAKKDVPIAQIAKDMQITREAVSSIIKIGGKRGELLVSFFHGDPDFVTSNDMAPS